MALTPDQPRLLHRDSSHGYTDQPAMALSREPEAISESEQRAMSTQGRTAFSEARQVENERRDRAMWIERLRKVEQRASSKGVDIFKPQSEIRSQILTMERMVDETSGSG